MDNYIISTKRLGLRKWIEEDVSACIDMNKDPEVMKYFPETMTDLETMAMISRIRQRFEKSGFGFYAVEKKSTKEFIGFTGFGIPSFDSFFTPCIEIGWRFKKDEWGNGFATEAATACLQFGFEKLEFEKILSFTSVLNLKSETVMQRIGMKKIGEFDHPFIEKGNRLCRHVVYEAVGS